MPSGITGPIAAAAVVPPGAAAVVPPALPAGNDDVAVAGPDETGSGRCGDGGTATGVGDRSNSADAGGVIALAAGLVGAGSGVCPWEPATERSRTPRLRA